MKPRNETKIAWTSAWTSAWTIAVMAGLATPASAQTTMTRDAGGANSWNDAANWDAGVPSGAVDVIVNAGLSAQSNDAATPMYNGTLTLNANATLQVQGNSAAVEAKNAIEGATSITMHAGSRIAVNVNANVSFPPIILLGDATLTSLFGASDHETDDFGAITGAHTLTLSHFNNHTVNLNDTNTFSELVCDAIDRWNLRAKAAGSLGTGNVIIHRRTRDARSATLYVDAPNAMAFTASLFLNGGGYSGTGSDRMVLNADLIVRELWIDGAQQASGNYTSADSFISAGSGTLTVLEGPGGGSEMLLVTTRPEDDAVDVRATSRLVAIFSKAIALGTGTITLRNLTDLMDTAIALDDARLTVSGPILSIDPGSALDWNKDYAIRIDPDAMDSVSEISFAGISDDTTWNFTTAPGDPLLLAIAGLEDHINGVRTLSAAQIDAHKLTLDAETSRFAESATTITALFDLVETYDSVIGPLWIARGQFDRNSQNNDLDWTMYNVMQSIVDGVYTAETIASHEDLLDGFKFGSSSHFPGDVAPPVAPDQTHTATINGSFPDTFGRITQGDDLPARKPTGTYLAPGTIATVTVPPPLVGQGFKVRVGAHSWDLSHRRWVRRLDRSTILYDLEATTIKLASPLGGGIYIEVPRLADAGIVDVRITGAVLSPYFSAKSFHRTTLSEWLDTERHHPAPWADFQTDKFMMQVPSSWIYALPDPVTLMANWDAAMDAMNDLMGFPHIRGKETMYPQVDVLLRSSVHAPGYPSVNVTYNPTVDYGGNHGHHLVKGPQYASNVEFHEQGHAYFFPKFPGERESNVNLHHVAVWHRKFGVDLDHAFRSSCGFGGNPHRTLDNTAVTWMTVFNFSPKEVPMATAEKAYQLKGHAKFVDIVRLFGWSALDDFWYSFNEDEENGVSDATDSDSMLLRLSRSVGEDIRPLFHFWGIHPENPAALDVAMAAEGLSAPSEIRELLLHYKSLVPADNAAFQTFAFNWWQGQPSKPNGYWTEREHARQWDDTVLWDPDKGEQGNRPNGEIFDEAASAEVRARVEEMIDLYYPTGNQEVFLRGQMNADASTDMTDALFLLSFLFVNGSVPGCLDACDTNDDGALDVADAFILLRYLFLGAPSLASPFPECAADPTDDLLGCETPAACP